MGHSTYFLTSLLGIHLSMTLCRIPGWEGMCLGFVRACMCASVCP